MSELALPDYLAKEQAEKAIQVEAVEAGDLEQKVAKQLPTPVGYQMLVSIPKIEEKYDSGIVKADVVVRNDEVATVIAFVIKQGPDCYKDTQKFPSGPYCKEGDFVLLRAYAGSRFKLHGVELRMINDDSISAVVQDPRGYTRI